MFVHIPASVFWVSSSLTQFVRCASCNMCPISPIFAHRLIHWRLHKTLVLGRPLSPLPVPLFLSSRFPFRLALTYSSKLYFIGRREHDCATQSVVSVWACLASRILEYMVFSASLMRVNRIFSVRRAPSCQLSSYLHYAILHSTKSPMVLDSGL